MSIDEVPAWRYQATPAEMAHEALLARLRERWPADGGGDGPADYAALLRATGWKPREPL